MPLANLSSRFLVSCGAREPGAILAKVWFRPRNVPLVGFQPWDLILDRGHE